MINGKLFHMIRSMRKISAVILACLLGLNMAAAAVVVTEPCSSSIASSGPMDMDHCDGMLNFAFPNQGCCGECNDIFCDLMKNPLQDANAVNSSPFQGSHYPFLPVSANPIEGSGARTTLSATRYLFSAGPPWSQVPLYIEHLSLII